MSLLIYMMILSLYRSLGIMREPEAAVFCILGIVAWIVHIMFHNKD